MLAKEQALEETEVSDICNTLCVKYFKSITLFVIIIKHITVFSKND